MLSFFPRGVLDEILNLIESVSKEFPSNSFIWSLVSSVVTNPALYWVGSGIDLCQFLKFFLLTDGCRRIEQWSYNGKLQTLKENENLMISNRQ